MSAPSACAGGNNNAGKASTGSTQRGIVYDTEDGDLQLAFSDEESQDDVWNPATPGEFCSVPVFAAKLRTSAC
jgi:hypothetical protein